MPSAPHARCNKFGNRDTSAGIVDHDLKLQTLYNDCYECEICLKWRHCPGEGFGEQDRFTCEMAPSPGLVPGDSGGCAREEDLEWLYEPGIIPRAGASLFVNVVATCGPLVAHSCILVSLLLFFWLLLSLSLSLLLSQYGSLSAYVTLYSG